MAIDYFLRAWLLFSTRRKARLNSGGAIGLAGDDPLLRGLHRKLINSCFCARPPSSSSSSHFAYVKSLYTTPPPQRREGGHNPTPITVIGAKEKTTHRAKATHRVRTRLRKLRFGIWKRTTRYRKTKQRPKESQLKSKSHMLHIQERIYNITDQTQNVSANTAGNRIQKKKPQQHTENKNFNKYYITNKHKYNNARN